MNKILKNFEADLTLVFTKFLANSISLISVFQEFSASVGKAFILAGGLGTRLSFSRFTSCYRTTYKIFPTISYVKNANKGRLCFQNSTKNGMTDFNILSPQNAAEKIKFQTYFTFVRILYFRSESSAGDLISSAQSVT